MRLATLLPFIFLLYGASCARHKEVKLSDKKAKCLEEKSGADCYFVGRLLFNQVRGAESSRSQRGLQNSAIQWLKLGCDYKSAGSCYELGSYLATIGHSKANYYLEKSCKLEKLDHCF